MSRVINTASPGKRRNRLRRTIAEMLRRVMLKGKLDEETKDMAAALVYCLEEIAETVDTAAAAWEKRNYYLKADRFLIDWEWVTPTAERLQDLIINDDWESLPGELAALVPRFADIRIAKMTRSPATWESSYRLLIQERWRQGASGS